MNQSADEDRRLFEAAVAEIERASASKIKRAKAENVSPAVRTRGQRRLDKRKKTAVPEAVLDLHGMERRPAEVALRKFLAANEKAELLLVVHGKGRGILRRATEKLLDEDRRVVEQTKAPTRLGGAGARLVRLRKRQ